VRGGRSEAIAEFGIERLQDGAAEIRACGSAPDEGSHDEFESEHTPFQTLDMLQELIVRQRAGSGIAHERLPEFAERRFVPHVIAPVSAMRTSPHRELGEVLLSVVIHVPRPLAASNLA
ncbi:MAG: hypothetical protein M3358_20110, partial [Actinomycetota bacterium]|nr:hypothetical protein [Actinomycetota bacterium]